MLKLQDFRDLHKDEDIFVLGSGPSLHFLNPNVIKGRPVICVNGSVMKFHKQADYYFTSDGGTVDLHHWEFVKNGQMAIILGKAGVGNAVKDRGELPNQNRIFYFEKDYELVLKPEAEALTFGISSPHCAVHFAHILGAKRIIIVGCDCCKSSDGKYYYWQYDGEEKDYWLRKMYYYDPENDPCGDYTAKDYMKKSAPSGNSDGNLHSGLNHWKLLKEHNPNLKIEVMGGELEKLFPKYQGD